MLISWFRALLVSCTMACLAGTAVAQPSSDKPDFPPFNDVIKDYEEVVSKLGDNTLFSLYIKKKDSQVLVELPRDYARQKHFIALTTASGETYAGLQGRDMYVYWRRYDNRLALVEANVETRSTGDKESKDSVERLFTDRVILDVPIVTENPKTRAPVIDGDALFVAQAGNFFPSVGSVNPRLVNIKTAKSFSQNMELGFEVPTAGGRLKTLHYSISVIPENTGYKPRVADERIGYFTTSYSDLGKYKADETRVRYINRWHLEKADSSLKMSPPKQPIVFYIEHTTPKRYRYWVKQGVLHWNEAFERVGFRDAIVVHQQDAETGAYMDKDPEDVQNNFIRWLNNDIATAIGPSRVNPMTGQILDADIVLTDGWIRAYERQFSELLPKIAMEGFAPNTLGWLAKHPNWDPRVILAPPAERSRLIQQLQREALKPMAGHPLGSVNTDYYGDDEFDGLVGTQSQFNGLCLAADGKAFEMAVLRMALELRSLSHDDDDDDDEEEDKEEEDKDEEDKDEDKEEEDKDEDKEEEDKDEDKEEEQKDDKDKKEDSKEEEQLLDGIPENFIGPLIADLVAHEVGHTLGLRHNFKASTIYTFDEINSEKVKGKPFAGSVMDYLPINMYFKEDCNCEPDHTMVAVGPYDLWAIEYGYTTKDADLPKILDRVAEPELVYGTDEDTLGPDPRARRYDFAKDPIEYAKNQVKLAKFHRDRIIEKFVKDGDSWSKARRGYEVTLSLQMRSVSMMANWIGGVLIARDKKGDSNGRKPMEVVSVEQQREALDFVIQNTFQDEAFGLTPELLQYFGADLWYDSNSSMSSLDSDWPIHDRIIGIQSSVLTMLMNPDTLQHVYDNELRTPADKDMLTLPELLDKIESAIWSEVDAAPADKFTARKPWISSLRRNLQREYVERLIDLTLPTSSSSAAHMPISNLATMKLRNLNERIGKLVDGDAAANIDPYSLAHLSEAKMRIEKALDAQFIYNVNDISGGAGNVILRLGEEPQSK